MEKILNTKSLECNKSKFLIDLVKYDSRTTYIAIQQTIQSGEGKPKVHNINIHSSLINSLVEILTIYAKDLNIQTDLSSKQKQEIVKRYLKGNVEIKDLAVQFNCSACTILQVLIDKNTSTVSNKIPVKEYYVWRKKRK